MFKVGLFLVGFMILGTFAQAQELQLHAINKKYDCQRSNAEILADLDRELMHSIEIQGTSEFLTGKLLSTKKTSVVESSGPFYPLPGSCTYKLGKIEATSMLVAGGLPNNSSGMRTIGDGYAEDTLQPEDLAKAEALKDAQWKCNSQVAQISDWLVARFGVNGAHASARFACLGKK